MHTASFVICVDNSGFRASLERRKIYEVVPDADAEGHGQVRVVDESGEDYHYPAACFVEADVSGATKAAIEDAR